MPKIPPSYYFKRAVKAETVDESVKYWTAFWNNAQLNWRFIVAKYHDGYKQLAKNIRDTVE